jgi:hypothetical protein
MQHKYLVLLNVIWLIIYSQRKNMKSTTITFYALDVISTVALNVES